MKYKITDSKIEHKSRILYQIKSIVDISTPYGTIKEGTLGGYVEHDYNLSQEGNCWIMPQAKVYDNARVQNNAYISGNSEIYGYAIVKDAAQIIYSTKVFDSAIIKNNSYIDAMGSIYGDICLDSNSCIIWNVDMYSNSQLRTYEYEMNSDIHNITIYTAYKDILCTVTSSMEDKPTDCYTLSELTTYLTNTLKLVALNEVSTNDIKNIYSLIDNLNNLVQMR